MLRPFLRTINWRRIFLQSQRPLIAFYTSSNVNVKSPIPNTPIRRPPSSRKWNQRARAASVVNFPPIPVPSILGIPDTPLCGTIASTMDACEWIFKGLDEAQTFISRYTASTSTPDPIVEAGPVPNRRGVFRAVLRLPINEEVINPEFSGITEIVGLGEGIRVSHAKTIARRDLAERLYRVLKDPLSYFGQKAPAAVKGEISKRINVEIDPQLANNISVLCEHLNKTNVFDCADLQVDDVENKSSSSVYQGKYQGRRLQSIPPEVYSNLVVPTRVSSSLPINSLYQSIVQTIESNSVTVLSAATGSGKTTQVPQFILDAYKQEISKYRDREPSVLVTQPRRIAAKTVAQRVAQERNTMQPGLGDAIGYSVRFDSKPPRKSFEGNVTFCTAGILLRRLQREPTLASITHLILDEVHERDVFTDVLLLVIKKILPLRPDLKVILMSATLESNVFVNYFERDGFQVGKIFDIEGTNYPIKKHYLTDILSISKSNINCLSDDSRNFINAEITETNVTEGENNQEDFGEAQSMSEGTLIIKDHKLQEIPFDLFANLIEHIAENEAAGAILVFLPGWEEIVELQTLLNSRFDSSQAEIHLLHSSCPVGSADAAFRRPPEGVRKIILATNIAESSVTIPDVVYVLDSGKQKVMHYDQKLRMNVLEPCWISKANLRQRLGRAGRCQPGKYYGFFTERRASSLPEQTLPELLRLSLDEVCLNLKAMGFAEPSMKLLSSAVSPPEKSSIRTALERLKAIRAIDYDESLTPLGKLLANIPINPALGRMLIISAIFGCVGPILTTVAQMGQSIFRPARLPHEKFDLHHFFSNYDPNIFSDHLLVHKIYKNFKTNGFNFGPEIAQHENIVSRPALRRLNEARSQIFKELRSNFGVLRDNEEADVSTFEDNHSLIRLILTSGLYPEIAVASDKRNIFELKMIKRAIIGTTSVNSRLGKGVLDTNFDREYENSLPWNARGRYSHKKRSTSTLKKCPKGPGFVVYEELLDIGVKMICKTTAVDPLFFLLFSKNTREEVASDGGVEFIIEDWLRFRPTKEEQTESLRRLAELRLHWDDFVQFIVYKHLRDEPLNEMEKLSVKQFKEVIMQICQHSRLDRSITAALSPKKGRSPRKALNSSEELLSN